MVVKSAVKEAVSKERHFKGEQLRKQEQINAKLSDKVKDQSSRMTELLDRSVTAESSSKIISAAANLSEQRSKELSLVVAMYKKELEVLKKENTEYRDSMQELSVRFEESEKRDATLEKGIPIKVIKKEKRKVGKSGVLA